MIYMADGIVQRLWLNMSSSSVTPAPFTGDWSGEQLLDGQFIALEVSHRNRTVCAIDFTKHFTCFSVDAPGTRQWRMPVPDLFEAMVNIAQMRLDWTSGNWYFMNRVDHVIVVCTQRMQHCTIVVEEFGHTLNSMVLDPTKG